MKKYLLSGEATAEKIRHAGLSGEISLEEIEVEIIRCPNGLCETTGHNITVPVYTYKTELRLIEIMEALGTVTMTHPEKVDNVWMCGHKVKGLPDSDGLIHANDYASFCFARV